MLPNRPNREYFTTCFPVEEDIKKNNTVTPAIFFRQIILVCDNNLTNPSKNVWSWEALSRST